VEPECFVTAFTGLTGTGWLPTKVVGIECNWLLKMPENHNRDVQKRVKCVRKYLYGKLIY
jgi:hypothetical protein